MQVACAFEAGGENVAQPVIVITSNRIRVDSPAALGSAIGTIPSANMDIAISLPYHKQHPVTLDARNNTTTRSFCTGA